MHVATRGPVPHTPPPRFFEDQAKLHPEQYLKFFQEFGHFLKEGVCSDQQHQVLCTLAGRRDLLQRPASSCLFIPMPCGRSLQGCACLRVRVLCVCVPVGPNREAAAI